MSALWKCGHPRTEENTQRIGKAGVRCRKCRQVISNRHVRKKLNITTDRQHVWPLTEVLPIPTREDELRALMAQAERDIMHTNEEWLAQVAADKALSDWRSWLPAYLGVPPTP